MNVGHSLAPMPRHGEVPVPLPAMGGWSTNLPDPHYPPAYSNSQ
jgi:hypothetical protein